MVAKESEVNNGTLGVILFLHNAKRNWFRVVWDKSREKI